MVGPGTPVDGWMLTRVATHGGDEDDVTAALATASPLTAADRCDRCGAQAYVRVTLMSGGELLFCAHHARRFEPKLREMAADIHDETQRLGDVPASAPADER